MRDTTHCAHPNTKRLENAYITETPAKRLRRAKGLLVQVTHFFPPHTTSSSPGQSLSQFSASPYVPGPDCPIPPHQHLRAKQNEKKRTKFRAASYALGFAGSYRVYLRGIVGGHIVVGFTRRRVKNKISWKLPSWGYGWAGIEFLGVWVAGCFVWFFSRKRQRVLLDTPPPPVPKKFSGLS